VSSTLLKLVVFTENVTNDVCSPQSTIQKLHSSKFMHTIDLANPSSNLPQNRRSCRADEGKSAAIIRIKLTVIFASLTSFQLSIDFQAFFSKSVIDVFRSFETLGSMLKRSTPHGFCDQRQFKPKFKTLSGPDYFVPAGQVKLSAIIDRFGLFYDPSH